MSDKWHWLIYIFSGVFLCIVGVFLLLEGAGGFSLVLGVLMLAFQSHSDEDKDKEG